MHGLHLFFCHKDGRIISLRLYPTHVHLHQFIHLEPLFVLLLQGEVFGDEEVLRRLGVQSGPSHVVEAVAVEEVVLLLSGAEEVEMENLAGVVVVAHCVVYFLNNSEWVPVLVIIRRNSLLYCSQTKIQSGWI